ncbi:hypothetical protein PRZ48_015202 [Zasmidium cellare]|uniref:Amidohydrolase-related domain-containing protein n=1 Tax=Zasmidium cellare TaxID=395010 RepID=A0ABR0DYD2_ZASCE|nr:hypothetical protein PRZ48_015202 [Zasmidium cellare]
MTADFPPLIALEEHYLSADFLDSEAYLKMYGPHMALNSALSQQLGDLSGGRITDMDANDISMQVISHAPGLHSLEQCKAANNQAYEAVKANPHRLAALAVLPAQMDADFNDENMSSGAIFSLSTSTWGWHSGVAMHIIKLFSAGVFDRFPNLKIVLGHFGEMIPFMLDRIDLFCRRWKKSGRMFKDVWSKNMWITTSGVWSIDPLAMILRNTSIDRIMFSIDYPFAPNKNGKLWMQSLIASDLVDEEGTKKIAFKNAEVLLVIKVT